MPSVIHSDQVKSEASSDSANTSEATLNDSEEDSDGSVESDSSATSPETSSKRKKRVPYKPSRSQKRSSYYSYCHGWLDCNAHWFSDIEVGSGVRKTSTSCQAPQSNCHSLRLRDGISNGVSLGHLWDYEIVATRYPCVYKNAPSKKLTIVLKDELEPPKSLSGKCPIIPF